VANGKVKLDPKEKVSAAIKTLSDSEAGNVLKVVGVVAAVLASLCLVGWGVLKHLGQWEQFKEASAELGRRIKAEVEDFGARMHRRYWEPLQRAATEKTGRYTRVRDTTTEEIREAGNGGA